MFFSHENTLFMPENGFDVTLHLCLHLVRSDLNNPHLSAVKFTVRLIVMNIAIILNTVDR